MDHFAYRDRVLFCEDVPVRTLAEAYGTPLWVYSQATLLHHLHHSQDLFVEAPGTRGQVMHVFNLPSYPYVFKVIKDRFGPGKTSDRQTVMSKFTMLKDVA